MKATKATKLVKAKPKVKPKSKAVMLKPLEAAQIAQAAVVKHNRFMNGETEFWREQCRVLQNSVYSSNLAHFNALKNIALIEGRQDVKDLMVELEKHLRAIADGNVAQMEQFFVAMRSALPFQPSPSGGMPDSLLNITADDIRAIARERH